MSASIFSHIGRASCLLVAAFLLCACDTQQQQSAPPPKVHFKVLESEPVALTTELPGRVSAYMVSEVRPQVSGIIQERLFEEGTDVARGQVLYQIDPALFEASFNNARANLAKAEANEVSAKLLAERYRKLVKVNAVSRQECDDAVAAHLQAAAEIQAARESVNTAKINLGYTSIKAPVSGRVGRSFITPGALVTQNQAEPLATIQHLDVVYVDVSQSNNDVLRLRRALNDGRMSSGGSESARVRLRLEDGTPYARRTTERENGSPDWIEGDLLFSEVTIDRSTGAVTLRAKFPNPEKVLLPGMYVRASLEEGVLDSALLVPQKSVLRDNRGRPFVYVLQENAEAEAGTGGNFTVVTRPVEVARSIGNSWLIKSGLEPGERLLVEGHLKARPGQLVSGVDIGPGRDGSFSAALPQNTSVR